jgi:hypothetical protein
MVKSDYNKLNIPSISSPNFIIALNIIDGEGIMPIAGCQFDTDSILSSPFAGGVNIKC